MLYFLRSAPRAPQCSSALQGGGSERVSSAAPAKSPSSHSPQNRQLEPPERPAHVAEPWAQGDDGVQWEAQGEACCVVWGKGTQSSHSPGPVGR